jgi:hypothetical protein
MHTPTHILIGAAILSRPGRPYSVAAAIAGSLVPDVPMYVMLVWAWSRGLGDADLWPMPNGLYWDPTWQMWTNATHALPIYLGVLAGAAWLRLDWLKVFALAGLLHIAFDLPVHREDGHAHLWPFSDWTFISPVSYWDVDHYGQILGLIEVAIVLGTIVVLWRRYEGWLARAAITGSLAAFAAAPVYFIFFHH